MAVENSVRFLVIATGMRPSLFRSTTSCAVSRQGLKSLNDAETIRTRS